MSRVLLVDIDSTIPNLALMKISAYYKKGGDTVGFNVDNPDRAYISCIFQKNRHKALSSANMLSLEYPGILIDIGGPGYDLKKTLPMEIEKESPDYSLYPDIDYSMGFTTRGCIRKCPFCIVPIKEGPLKFIQPIEEIYNPRFSAIKLLDNNVLANMDNFRHIIQFCIEHDLKLDISQGLDARLLTPESANLLKKVKPLKTFTFAFDSLSYRPQVERAIDLLKEAGIDVRGSVQFYVYCNRDRTGEYGIASAIERCNILKSLGTSAYVMLDINQPPTKKMRHLKRWANRKHIFWSCEFKDYLKRGCY